MAEETVIFARKASGLVREISWLDVMLITIAGPAASGMTYYTVKIPGQYPGGNVIIAFVLGGLIWLLPVALIAVYASSFPRSGAMYVVISRAIHPVVGFLPNWLWVLSSGFAAGFLNYLGLNLIASALQVGGQIGHHSGWVSAGNWILGPTNHTGYTRLWMSLLLTIVLWGMELLGMDRLKWFIRAVVWIPLVITIAAVVIFFVTNGQNHFDQVYGSGASKAVIQAYGSVTAGPKGDFATGVSTFYSAWGGAGKMLLAVFWAYSALESISFVGSEVKTPRTSFIRGMGIGFFAVMFLYIINAVAPNVSYHSEFIRDYGYLFYNGHTDVLQKALGGVAPATPSIPFYAAVNAGSAWFAIVLAVCFFMWYWNTSLVLWMGSIRGLFAMAFDRQMPIALCKVSKRGTPTVATHFIGAAAVIGCFIGLGDAAGGRQPAEVMLAILDFTGLFFIWTVGLAGLFLPFTRPDLFEKTTFQYKVAGIPLMAIFGAIVLGIGFYINLYVGLELATTYSQLAMSGLIVLGFSIVAFMYHRNRKQGIDPTQIYAQIPPA